MNATPECTVPMAGAAAAEGRNDPIAALATDAADVVSGWAGLLDLELALAQRSLRWLLIGAIALPVAGLSAWLSLNAVLVAGIHVYTSNWLFALLLGVGVQVLALAILLRQLRRWARDLTLPQSRAALVHAMERMS